MDPPYSRIPLGDFSGPLGNKSVTKSPRDSLSRLGDLRTLASQPRQSRNHQRTTFTVKPQLLGRIILAPALGAWSLAFTPVALHATAYQQTNLVSDVPGLAANTDPNLVNPWGIASSATSPFWVSNAGTGVSGLYNSAGAPQALVVSIPSPGPGPSVPTGQVFNGGSAFNADRFLFASARGTISGWRPALGTNAEILVNNSAAGASYLGLTLGTSGSDTFLYAADFARGQVDVFSGSGAPIINPGAFTDSTIPVDYSPFNIENIGGTLFVTYALRGADGFDVAGPGNGYINRYDLSGNLLGRFASGGALNSPWGMAQAPAGFGDFSGSLLVGNFGDGTINAFDPGSGALLGTLTNVAGNPIVNEGLWGLRFGNGGNGGTLGTLYFAAGIDDEEHGLFGSISAVPDGPDVGGSATLFLAGLSVLGWLRRRTGAPLLGN